MPPNSLARQIFLLRCERGWSLDHLARLSGLSRASLSRIENADVSPTVDSLNKICAAFGVTASHLMAQMEDAFADTVSFDAQAETVDPETGKTRRSVSPPATELKAKVVEDHLPPDTQVSIAAPQNPGCEHHLIMLDGALAVTLDTSTHDLTAGDCLRYLLNTQMALQTPESRGARYLLVTL